MQAIAFIDATSSHYRNSCVIRFPLYSAASI